MIDQLLTTKLYIPPVRPSRVSRPRLLQRLDEGLSQGVRLILVSGPAGFGKTTLLAEWVNLKHLHLQQAQAQVQVSQISNLKIAWLSLDEHDGDLARFWSYVIAALQTVQAEVGQAAQAMLRATPPAPIEAVLTSLINDAAARLPSCILVLDDYHALEAKPVDAAMSVDDALTFLLDHLPQQMRLVIATREDPHLPLAQLRVRGQLTELRAANLRFTPSEAAEFLNQVMGLNLSEEDIAALEARTEGWIAGLQLAALSMQGREDIASFIQAFTGSHRFVLDYLVEQVLQHQSEQIRSFLLQTAMLDRFCAPLCNAVCSVGTGVTEREDGKEMLDVLERSNLFLIPLDDKRQWYRYHHLFADVLQTHLMEAQPDRVATLHLRASAWYEQNGLRPDAIRHALAAQDLPRAAGLIELAGPATEDGSIQPATWLGWVKTLPEELVHVRPVLNVWYAYALLGRGELEAAEARLKDAERWLEPTDTMKAQLEPPSLETCPESNRKMVVVDQEQFKSLSATIAVGRAYIAQALGNIPDTVRYASRVLELVPEGDNFRHAQASMLLGMTYWASGDLEAANRVFADYTMKLRAAGNIPDAISTTVVLADIRLALGRLHEAIRTVEQLLQFVLDQGEPIPLDTADLHRELGELYLEQGNLEAAAQHLQRSKELVEKAQLPVLRYRWCIDQARLKKALSDLDGALAILNEAERLYIRSPLPDFCPISAMKAQIWVVQGRLTKALEWVREQGLSPDNDLCYLREFEHITLARILIAQYQNDRMEGSIHAAMRLLDRLLQAAEEGERMGSVIEILVLQALAHQAQGNITPALTPLERALALAEPEGYVRIFVDEGEPMRLMISDFAQSPGLGRLRISDRPLYAYADRLLLAFSQAKPAPTQIRNQKSTTLAPHASAGVQNLVEPLSERELQVLRLLRTDLNGPEIARELMVSLSTLRTHTQNIYAKLGVNNRRAAVRRAEELDLL